MSEQEIKLHIPKKSREKIQKLLSKANTIRLRAMYFDTEDRQLAKAKVAIRLRQEGEDWVQTLKMEGANSLSRIELNHNRPSPILDLSLYAGTVAEPVLAKLSQPLGLRYETEVIRRYKKQRSSKGTVEIAFDTGVIRAGRLELPIHEVEFELKSGDIQALFDLSQRWLKEYQLILDVRTKSHRGDALANMMAKINAADEINKDKIEAQETQRFWAEHKTKSSTLARHLSATQALCRLTEECVEQMAINASYLAEVDTADIITVAQPEHVHQLRIGMRRLISHWKLFAGYAHLPDTELMSEIKVFLNTFGATRDTDVMLETIMPPLEKAGMPPIEVDHYQGKSATELARDTHFQSFLVKLLAWVCSAPSSDPVDEDKATPEEAPLDVLAIPQDLATPPNATPSTEIDTINTATIAIPHSDDISTENTNLSGDETPFLDIIPLVPNALSSYSLRKILEKRLNKWNKSIVNHWRSNNRQDIESYHDLRKKIKRMRYGLSVYETLEGHGNLQSYIKRLAKAQDVFGQLNDYSTAKQYFEGITQTHPEAWFAVGWLSAQLDNLKKEADVSLKLLPKKIQFN